MVCKKKRFSKFFELRKNYLRICFFFHFINRIVNFYLYSVVIINSNSIPPTTNVENLRLKQKAATGKICVDVAFWGGIIPGNQNELTKLLEQGVIGFKCFLHPSGDEAFPYVEEEDVELALKQLVGLDALVAVRFTVPVSTEQIKKHKS